MLCGLSNSNAASNGTPTPTLQQRHAKEKEKKKWPEKVATRFTLIYSRFPRSVQHVSSTVYEKAKKAGQTFTLNRFICRVDIRQLQPCYLNINRVK